MSSCRLFEYRNHWLTRRGDTDALYIYWCRPGTRRVRRRSTGTADIEEARRRLIAFADGKPVPVGELVPQRQPAIRLASNTDPPILDVLSTHVARFEGRPSHTTAMGALKHWIHFCESEDIVYVHEMTIDVQERYVAHRRKILAKRGQPGSNATINRELYILGGAVRHAWRRGQIASVPFVMSLPNPPARDKFLSAEQAQKLLAACDQPYIYRYVLLGLHTLARPKAIFGLRTNQVDLANGRINFLPPGAMQSNKRKPIVPITPTLRAELLKAVDESQSGFVIEKDGLPLRSMRKAFRRVAVKAGLPPDTTPYVLRHTGATLLAASGVPMHQIAQMLGHTTQRTTEIYAKRRPEFLLETVSTLERLFEAQAPEMSLKSTVATRAPICAPSARQNRVNRPIESGGATGMKPQTSAVWMMVDPGGIEPPTSTMPLSESQTRTNIGEHGDIWSEPAALMCTG
jgi:integrase